MESLFDVFLGLSHGGVNYFLSALWPCLALCVVLWLLFSRTRLLNAATRYAVCWMALLTVAALPVLMLAAESVVPPAVAAWQEWISDPEPVSGNSGIAAATDPEATGSRELQVKKEKSENLSVTGAPSRTARTAPLRFAEGIPRTVEPSPGSISMGNMREGLSKTVHDEKTGTADVILGLTPALFVMVWMVGAMILLVHLAVAYVRVRLVIAQGTALSPAIDERLAYWYRRLGCTRTVRLLVSDRIGSPAAVGFRTGTILLPAHLVQRLSSDELDAVLLHELTHLHRRDDWSRLAEQLLSRLLFVNPLVHWLVRQLDLQREIACDDLVLANTGNPRRYARALARVVELQDTSRLLALAPGLLASKKQIFSRFEMILDRRRTLSTVRPRRVLLAALLIMLATVVGVLSTAPAIAIPSAQVAFEDLFSERAEQAKPEEPLVAVDAATAEPTPLFAAAGMAALDGETLLGTLDGSNVMLAAGGDLNDDVYVIKPDDDAIHYYDLSGMIGSRRDDVSITYRGKIDFTDDYDAVESISRRGFLEIIDDRDDVSRRLLVELDADDRPEHVYREDGRRKKFDDEAREWVRSVLKRAGRRIERNETHSETRVDLSGRKRSRLGNVNVVIPDIAYAPSVWAVPGVPPVPSMPAVPSVPSAPSAPGYLMVPDVSDLVDQDEIRDAVREAQRAWREVNRQSMAEAREHQREAMQEAQQEAMQETQRAYAEVSRDYASMLDRDFGFDYSGTMSVSDDDGHHVVIKDGRRKMSFSYDGEIEFTDDDRDVASLEPGGFLEVEERVGSKRRKLLIESDRDGKLDYVYSERGRTADFDDEAREWFADMILEAVRNTGIGAENRVRRIREKDGVQGVLDEIRFIDSDYAKRIYYAVLLDEGDLSEQDVQLILSRAGHDIDSDYEKAELLIATTDYLTKPAAYADEYVDAIATLDSDYETRRVLTAILFDDHEELDRDVVAKVLDIADRMDSDYEKAELLIDLARYAIDDPDLRSVFIEAVSGLDSDYETRRVLTEMGRTPDLTTGQARLIMEIADGMDSDFEKAELLIEYADATDDPELLKLYLEASSSIDSDYEKRRVLNELGGRRDVTPEHAASIIDMAGEMDSDFEKAELLIDYADAARDDPELLKFYVTAALDIDSDYERRRVLSQIRVRRDTDEDLVLEIMRAVDVMDSDYEKAEMLIDLADAAVANKKIRDEYLMVATGLDSDYERARVLQMIIDEGDDDPEFLREMIMAIDDITSDHERATLLRDIADPVSMHDELEDDYLDALEAIESDFERDRLYRSYLRKKRNR